MTVDTRIKNELFEHVISKLVLAVYTVSLFAFLIG
jgi:hypothetical protein